VTAAVRNPPPVPPGELDTRNVSWFAESPDVVAAGINADNDLSVRWWRETRPRAAAAFDGDVRMWRVQRAGKASKDAPDYYRRLRGMGIVVLPDAVRRIRDGEADLVPLVSELTDKAVPWAATADDVAAWWAADEKAWAVPTPCRD
jgi:hypothetical protein